MTATVSLQTSSFEIPVHSVTDAKSRLKALSRRCAKLGLPEYSATFGTDEREVEVTHFIGGSYEPLPEVKRLVTVIDIEVTGPRVVSSGGWTLVGTIEFLEGTDNLITLFADDVEGVEQFRNHSTCDHCAARRNRKQLFIVRAEDGELKAIGSNCLKDFLGTDDVAAFLYLFEVRDLFTQIFGCDEDELFARCAYTGTPFRAVLEQACAIYRKIGFTGRKKADEIGKAANADFLLSPEDFHRNGHDVTDEDRQTAVNIIGTIPTIKEETGDTLWRNVYALAECGFCSIKKHGGLIAFIPCAVDIYTGRKKRLDDASSRKHTGTVGERQSFEGTLERVRGYQSHYGEGTITIVRLDSGDTLQYWNFIGEEGHRARFDAAVKEHAVDSYDQGAITVISRASKVKAWPAGEPEPADPVSTKEVKKALLNALKGQPALTAANNVSILTDVATALLCVWKRDVDQRVVSNFVGKHTVNATATGYDYDRWLSSFYAQSEIPAKNDDVWEVCLESRKGSKSAIKNAISGPIIREVFDAAVERARDAALASKAP